MRHNVHEYYGPGGDSESVRGESIVERLRRQRLMLSFKKSADTLASFDIYHIDIQVTAVAHTARSYCASPHITSPQLTSPHLI